MSDPHDTPRPRPHTGSMAATFLEFDLHAEWQSLRAETTWSTGHNAKTLAKYDDFRVVLIAFRAGARLAEHKTEGRISVHLLAGHVRVKADGRTFDLRPASLLTLDQGVPHDVDALEESALLLTIAWPARARG